MPLAGSLSDVTTAMDHAFLGYNHREGVLISVYE